MGTLWFIVGLFGGRPPTMPHPTEGQRTGLWGRRERPFPLRIRAGPLYMWVGLLAGLLVLSGGHSLHAQTPDLNDLSVGTPFVRKHWTVEDGLPVNSVIDLQQDQDGYLWIATHDGLVRFDGVRFTVYRSGAHQGLPSSRIRSVSVDRNGGLWLNTQQRHLVRYADHRFVHVDSLRGEADLQVFTVRADASGRLWVGTDRGVARISAMGDNSEMPIEIPAPAEDVTADVLAIEWGTGKTLWLGTRSQGLLRVAPDGGVRRWGPRQKVPAVHRDGEGRIWVGTPGGLARADVSSGQLVPVQRGGTPWTASVLSIQSDGQGTLWLGTERGLYVRQSEVLRPYEPASSAPVWGTLYSEDRDGHAWARTERHLYRDDRRVFETDKGILSVLHDREGNTWIGTATEGLHRLRRSAIQVVGPTEGLSIHNIYPVLRARSGAIWVGGIGGPVTRVAGGRVTSYDLPMSVWTLHQERSGVLWAGGEGYLCRLGRPPRVQTNPVRCRNAGIPRRLASDDPSTHTVVRTIYEDTDGRLWVGSTAGLYRRRAECTAGVGCWQPFTEADGLPEHTVRVIHEQTHESGAGTLWMGTNGGGLIRLTPASASDRESSASAGRRPTVDELTIRDGLPSNLIRAIHEDERGVLWVGTEDAGLVRLDPRVGGPVQSMPQTSYRTADGLYHDGIHQILPDEAGRLWMSTNRGLFTVARAELEAFHRGKTDRLHSRSFTERDSLRSREANGGMQPAGTRDASGRLWFPTQNGVAVVTPSVLEANPTPPPVALEHLTARDTTYALSSGTQVALPANARDIEVKYTALSFVDPSKVRFGYRLETLDSHGWVGWNPSSTWIDAGTRREAFYTNVPPGRYTLRVQASSDDGVWNQEGGQIGVTVAPYFYETWAFAGACGVLVLLLAVGAVRWRTRRLEQQQARLQAAVADRTEEVREANEQLERQAERLQEADEAKSRFFSNISHEFRTPLTVALGVLEEWTEDPAGALPDDAHRDLKQALLNNRRLVRLVNQLLDVARLESESLVLRVQPLTLTPFVDQIAQAFVPLAERYDVAFRRSLPDETIDLVADPEPLETILANLLSNAFKFTPSGGRVELVVTQEASSVSITVQDTGPGIPEDEQEAIFDRFQRSTRTQDQPGTGLGLSLARGLAERHGGSLTVQGTPGEGAAFTLRLPLGTDHLEGRADVTWREEEERASTPPSPAHTPDARSHLEPLTDEQTAPPVDTEDGDEDTDAPDDDPRTTVLVVDDNADIRGYVRRHLEPSYRVVEAVDGEAGLNRARTLTPDCVLLDVMMPRMNGIEMLEQVRNDPATDFIPVILLTARATHQDKLGGLEAGADDYLTKPFRPDELRTRIRNLIAQRMRLRERFQEEDDGSASETVSSEGEEDRPPFLVTLEEIIRNHLSDEDFSVADLALEAGVSRSKLYRDLEPITDVSPADLIWHVRLDEGRALLQNGEGTISEVAYGVGFKSVSHFARRFRERFDEVPSTFVERVDT